MARHLEDGLQRDYCLYPILTSPQTCTSGQVRLSKPMDMFNMKFQTGQKQLQNTECRMQKIHHSAFCILHFNAVTTCNTGVHFPTSPSAREHMDMPADIVTPISCALKPTSIG